MTKPTSIATTDRSAAAVGAAIDKMRRAIMYGQLVPGQKLVEAALCRDLDISRPSLREALRVLESERLIELVPNRGPQVSRLDAQDVQEIQDVWSLLTGQAAHLFTRIATKEDLATQEQAYDRIHAVLEKGISLELLAASNEFFGNMVRRCGNNTLFDVTSRVVSRINFLRAQVILHRRLDPNYEDQLLAIMVALREKNSAAARRAVEKHIASVCRSAEQMLSDVHAKAI
jgi:DNA-binding GntR family transcriptional regulator